MDFSRSGGALGSLLQAASFYGQTEVIMSLLENHADVNRKEDILEVSYKQRRLYVAIIFQCERIALISQLSSPARAV